MWWKQWFVILYALLLSFPVFRWYLAFSQNMCIATSDSQKNSNGIAAGYYSGIFKTTTCTASSRNLTEFNLDFLWNGLNEDEHLPPRHLQTSAHMCTTVFLRKLGSEYFWYSHFNPRTRRINSSSKRLSEDHKISTIQSTLGSWLLLTLHQCIHCIVYYQV